MFTAAILAYPVYVSVYTIEHVLFRTPMMIAIGILWILNYRRNISPPALWRQYHASDAEVGIAITRPQSTDHGFRAAFGETWTLCPHHLCHFGQEWEIFRAEHAAPEYSSQSISEHVTDLSLDAQTVSSGGLRDMIATIEGNPAQDDFRGRSCRNADPTAPPRTEYLFHVDADQSPGSYTP